MKLVNDLVNSVVDERDAKKEAEELKLSNRELVDKLGRMRAAKNAYRQMANQSIRDMKYTHVAGDIYADRRWREMQVEFDGIKDEE